MEQIKELKAAAYDLIANIEYHGSQIKQMQDKLAEINKLISEEIEKNKEK